MANFGDWEPADKAALDEGTSMPAVSDAYLLFIEERHADLP